MTTLARTSPFPLALNTDAEKARLRFRARLLFSEGWSYGRVAARLGVSRSEAWRLVNRVPKAGPLPLKGMVRRAA